MARRMAQPTLADRYDACRAALKARGQEHVLRWWDELDPSQRDQLLIDIESIPWDVIDPLIQTHVLGAPGQRVPDDLSPPEVYPPASSPTNADLYERAIERGEALLKTGKVAAFTVAGGQGTRLGVAGPKGMVIVTPVGDRSLFELFAETVKAARCKHGSAIPWYIMTSPVNHQETVDYFRQNDHFGLPCDDVAFFPQAVLPMFHLDGTILLAAKHRLALGPDGHGGSLKALAVSGALDDMQRRGVSIVSYFQVDNPLVKPFDPLFIGLHAITGSEMSTKVTAKADDLERVGNLCVSDGKLTVIEYSDFPEECARARNDDGSRKFDAGNLAIHLFDAAFLRRVTRGDLEHHGASGAHPTRREHHGASGTHPTRLELPFRRAVKAMPYIDETGSLIEPDAPNAIKLETFVFDALPMAAHPLLLQVDRSEEFSPVKNASGIDSLETAKRDQVARACRWLEAAGVKVPRSPDGTPAVVVAIAPSLAIDAKDLEHPRDRLPPLDPEAPVYLA